MFNPKQINFIKILVIAAIAGAAIGTVLWLLIPKEYTSSASILFPGISRSAPSGIADQGPGGAGGAAGTGGGSVDQPSLSLMQGVLSMPQPGSSPSTAGMILKSRKTASLLIDKFDLAKEWGVNDEKAIEYFQQDFICSEGLSGDLKVSITDYDPKRAQQIIKAAIDVLTDSVEALSLDPAGRNLSLLKKSLENAQKDTEKAQQALVAFQKTLGGGPPDVQLETLGQIYSETLKNLYAAKVEAAAAATNSKSLSGQAVSMIAVAQDPIGSEKSMLSILYNKMVDKETELANLRQKYTDIRPEVVAAKQSLEVARKDLSAEITRQLTGVKSGASPYVKDAVLAAVTANAKVQGLTNAEASIRQKMQDLPSAQAKYNQLQLDLRDQRSRLTLVRGEYVKAELIAQSRGPQFVVVDPPGVPLKANGLEWYWWMIFGAIPGTAVLVITVLSIVLKNSMKSLGL